VTASPGEMDYRPFRSAAMTKSGVIMIHSTAIGAAPEIGTVTPEGIA